MNHRFRLRISRLRSFTIALLAVLAHLLPVAAETTTDGGGSVGTPHPSAIASTSQSALLANLVPSSGTLSPAFSSHTFHYGMALPAATTSLSLIATAAGENATLTVNGTPVTSGIQSGSIPLQIGANTLTIQITTLDGTASQTYGITALVPATSPGSDNVQIFTDPSRFPSDSSNYGNFTVVGDRAFFTNHSNVHGTELWTSDGTTEGTVLVRDINPGTGSIYIFDKTVMDGTLYFTISRNVDLANSELWKSDGTEAGTVRVRNMRPNEDSMSHISELTVCGGTLFFRYMDTHDHSVLWKSDGSEAGTLPVMELQPPLPTYHYATLTAVGSTLYFQSANNLWKTDGTSDGTRLVINLPAPTQYFKGAADILYFTIAHEGRIQLWKSDGTEAGTQMIGDFQPPSPWDSYLSLTSVGSVIYFHAYGDTDRSELWRTDGTAAGTMMLKDFVPNAPWNSPRSYEELGGALYFVDDAPSSTGLWKTDGTAEGSVRIWNSEAKWNGYSTSYRNLRGYTAIGSTVYLSILRSLYKSDGTGDGLVLIRDFFTGHNGSGPTNLTVVGNAVFFEISSGPGSLELWKSDGTEAGTVLVKDLSSGPLPENFSDLTVAGDKLYFLDTRSGLMFWASDGTAEGTGSFWNTSGGRHPGSNMPGFTDVDGTMFIIHWPSPGSFLELFTSDGTHNGTKQLKRFDQGPYTLRDLTGTVAMGGNLYFTAFHAGSGYELWKSDGTWEGTVMVRDIWEGTGSSEPGNLTMVGGVLYFSASDANSVRRLWKTDGTEAGTVRIPLLAEESWNNFDCLTAVGSTLYFTVSENGYGYELWKSDGTTEGTIKLTDRLNLQIQHSVAVGNTLYFQAYPTYREMRPQLWKSDGTAEGTVLVKEIYSWENSGSIRYLGVVNDDLYFNASDGAHGAELWKTDGTEVGTVMVKDISPGAASGSPTDGIVVKGFLYFQATDGPHGAELWKSDGTAEGTVMIRDIVEGTGSSAPGNLTLMGTKLYFFASTASLGAQLHLYDTAAEAPVIRNMQAHSISRTAATLAANVVDGGNHPVTARGIIYAPASISADPQIGGAGVINLMDGGSIGAFEFQTTGLAAGITYACRAYATNAQGTAYSPLAAFTTLSQDPADYWRDTFFANGGNTGTAADLADPDEDGIVNLLERAFRLHPLTPGTTTLVPGTGTTGLPSIITTDGPEGPVLTVQYIRQKNSVNSGLTYNPQFASDLGAPWQDFTGSETVESIDAVWERVTIQDPALTHTARFGRVSVSAAP